MEPCPPRGIDPQGGPPVSHIRASHIPASLALDYMDFFVYMLCIPARRGTLPQPAPPPGAYPCGHRIRSPVRWTAVPQGRGGHMCMQNTRAGAHRAHNTGTLSVLCQGSVTMLQQPPEMQTPPRAEGDGEGEPTEQRKQQKRERISSTQGRGKAAEKRHDSERWWDMCQQREARSPAARVRPSVGGHTPFSGQAPPYQDVSLCGDTRPGVVGPVP